MKKTIILISGVTLALCSCDDNAWNDHLDGFDGNASYTDVKTISYTLTANDYATISTLANNVQMAGEANAKALAAVKSQQCFSEAIPAKNYIPAFLASSKFPYFTLDNGSVAKVTYNVAEPLPAELTELAAAGKLTVSEDNYKEAWGSDEKYIKAFAPSVTPGKVIPGLLAASSIDTETTTYAVVTYDYSQQEPVFADAPAPSYNLIKAVKTGVPCIIVADGNAASTDENKGYGYLLPQAVTVDGTVATGNVGTGLFTFTAAEGGYYMQDGLGRYLYMKGTYNNFNYSATQPDAGGVWDITFNANGEVTIMNVEKQKWIQWDGAYSSYGAYDSAKGVLPKMYEGDPSAVSAPQTVVETETVYALYHYNGSAWKVDNSVAVLQPSDYASMGFSSNYMPDANAADYLPIYMKQKYPYAAKNDKKFVVYFNSSKSAINAKELIYNGTDWSVFNGKVTKTLKFEKNNGVWGVAPGLAVFTHTRAGEIVSGEKYLIVTGTNAATSLSTEKTYGYLNVTTVESDEENVNLPDAQLCEFTLTLTGDGYTMQDCYGRYYYQSGTYNSFNVSTEIGTNSNDGYYWDIVVNDDGTATITNTLVTKVIQYDENYTSYGSYANITHELPSLYRAVGE